MPKIIAVADITKADRLTDAEVVSSVHAIVGEHHVDPSDIHVVATPNFDHLRDKLSTYHWSTVPSQLVVAGHVRQFISTCSRTHDNPFVSVFTYLGDVRKLERVAWRGVVVTTHSFGALRHPGGSVDDATAERAPLREVPSTRTSHSGEGSEANSAGTSTEPPRGTVFVKAYGQAGYHNLFSHTRVATECALERANVTSLREPRFLLEIVNDGLKVGQTIIESWPEERRPKSPNLPWRSTLHFVTRLVLEAGVAIGEDGEPLRPANPFTKVVRFIDEWKMALYAHLLKILLLSVGSLSESDIRPLAGVWFYDDGAEAQITVYKLLNLLVDKAELQVSVSEGVKTWSLPMRTSRLSLV